jgi:putative peptidoglycan lipid II flippase
MKRATTLGTLAAGNLLVSFLIQSYVVVTVGPGQDTDALFAALAIPNVVLLVVAGSLSHALVPILTRTAPDLYGSVAWAFVYAVGLAFAAIAFALWAAASLWVPVIFPGFDAESAALTADLVRIQVLALVFQACTGVLWAAHRARSRFVLVEMVGLLTAIAGFVFVLVCTDALGIESAALANVIMAILQFSILSLGLAGASKPMFRSPEVRLGLRKMAPLIAGSAYTKTDQIVDRFLASMAPSGELSLLYLASRLLNSGVQIINKAITTPMMTQLSVLADHDDWECFEKLVRNRFLWVTTLTTLPVLGLVLFGEDLLALIFGHRNFTSEDVATLSIFCLAISGILIGGGLGQIMACAHYAAGDTVSPTLIGAVGFTVGIGLKVLGFYLFGVPGIAIATTVYFLLNAALLTRSLAGKVRQWSDRSRTPV